MLGERTIICALLSVSAISFTQAAQTGGTTGTGNAGGAGQVGTAGKPASGQGANNSAASQGLALQRGDKLIGMSVEDSSGAQVGRIDDLVLRSDGSIAYAVISAADGEGTEYPVPWRTLRMQNAPPDVSGTGPKVPAAAREARAIFTGIDSTRWRTGPHFERANWPKDGDTKMFEQTDSFYGSATVVDGNAPKGARPIEASAPTSAEKSMYMRATKLQNGTVTDAKGQTIGRLGQLVFDPVAGRLNYAAVALEDATGAKGRMIAMPWESLRASRQDDADRLQWTGSSDRLGGAPQFTSGDESWKQMSDPKWVGEMYSYYSVRPYWNTSNAPGSTPGTGGGSGEGSDQGKGGTKTPPH